jgi:pimeloyl-ACP methyl ester carboxylesterase
MHGFPYDPRCYDAVAEQVNAAGFRTIVPYLRGYGPTCFRATETPRSGQQAALADDLLQLMNALEIRKAVVAGYDWGGRAACIVSALWPERVQGLVTCCGYNLQNIPASVAPAAPAQEHRHWYQYYFHTERGRAGLTANRREVARLLWTLWSPKWDFDDATFDATAKSFDNPDFVDVVIQSYRHRYGYADGDPTYDDLEKRLEAQPDITVPTISLHGDADGVSPIESSVGDKTHFTGPYDRRVVPDAGHNVPQEAPDIFADAVIELCRG